MDELSVDQADDVGGGKFSFGNWFIGNVLGAVGSYVYDATMSGKIDYAGVAEQQGTYYNTVGA
jgi:hypothetical protein